MTRLLLPSLMVLLVTLPAAAQRRVITHEDVFTMTRTATRVRVPMDDGSSSRSPSPTTTRRRP